MVKNKGGKKNPKPDKAFIVKNNKKSKTKAVTTNLKKLNIQTEADNAKAKLNVQAKADNAKAKATTDVANERFASLQDQVKQVSAKDLKKKGEVSKQKSCDVPSTSVDMDKAAADFAKL